MSIDARGESPADAGQAVVLAERARRLLVGGVIGCHALALPAVLVWAVVDGARGLLSALVGLALVLVFDTIGQAVQIRFAGAAPRVLMRASLLSFGLRASVLGLLVVGWSNLPAESVARVNAMALAVTGGLSVVGWLVGVVLTYRRLRIPIYDEPSDRVYDNVSENASEGGRPA
ncbi:hypothetical protein [Desertihabitans brevis]|nr:hypothetical protein [Desertihabitans brevis]